MGDEHPPRPLPPRAASLAVAVPTPRAAALLTTYWLPGLAARSYLTWPPMSRRVTFQGLTTLEEQREGPATLAVLPRGGANASSRGHLLVIYHRQSHWSILNQSHSRSRGGASHHATAAALPPPPRPLGRPPAWRRRARTLNMGGGLLPPRPFHARSVCILLVRRPQMSGRATQVCLAFLATTRALRSDPIPRYLRLGIARPASAATPISSITRRKPFAARAGTAPPPAAMVKEHSSLSNFEAARISHTDLGGATAAARPASPLPPAVGTRRARCSGRNGSHTACPCPCPTARACLNLCEWPEFAEKWRPCTCRLGGEL